MKARGLLLFAPHFLACGGCHDGAAGAPAATATGSAPVALSSDGAGGSPPVALSSASAAPALPEGETVIHVEDDGKSFDVAHGGTITFKLASNAGTGYAWVPTQVDPAVLAQQGDRSSEIASDTPGAPKLDVYRFAAAAPGSTTVELALRRAFGGPPGRTIRVSIRVH